MFWIADSSQELEAILEMEALFIDLAIENPVDAEKFEENFRDFLENNFEVSSFRSIMFKGEKHFSEGSDRVEAFFFTFEVFSEFLDSSVFRRENSI